MADKRFFSLKPEIKISMDEAEVLTSAYEKMKGRRIEVGHIVEEIAREAVDAAIIRFTSA